MYFVQSLRRLVKRTSKYLLLKLAQSTNLFVFRPATKLHPRFCQHVLYLQSYLLLEEIIFQKSSLIFFKQCVISCFAYSFQHLDFSIINHQNRQFGFSQKRPDVSKQSKKAKCKLQHQYDLVLFLLQRTYLICSNNYCILVITGGKYMIKSIDMLIFEYQGYSNIYNKTARYRSK